MQRYSPEAHDLMGGRAQPGNETSSTAISAADINLEPTNSRLKPRKRNPKTSCENDV